MIKLDCFDMHDTFNTDKRTMLKYAMDAAKRHAETMWYQVRCVAIKDIKFNVEFKYKLFSGVANDVEVGTVYTIDVWGHEVEIPDEFKHWTERLQDHVNALKLCEAGNE